MAVILLILLSWVYGYESTHMYPSHKVYQDQLFFQDPLVKNKFTRIIIAHKIFCISMFYWIKIPSVFKFLQNFANNNLINKAQKQQIINFINGISLILYIMGCTTLVFQEKGTFPIKIIMIIDGILLVHHIINMYGNIQWIYLISCISFQGAGIIYLWEINKIQPKKRIIEETTMPILLF